MKEIIKLTWCTLSLFSKVHQSKTWKHFFMEEPSLKPWQTAELIENIELNFHTYGCFSLSFVHTRYYWGRQISVELGFQLRWVRKERHTQFWWGKLK